MAAKTHGTAYLYGIDGTYFTSAQIVSISLAQSDQIAETVENNSGQCVAERDDDQIDVLNATLRIESGFTRHVLSGVAVLAPVEAGTQKFDGSYKVKSVNETMTAKGFMDYSVTLEKKEYMTYTV